MKVLIVEDEVLFRKYLEHTIGKYAKCDLAVSGEQALEMFRKNLDGGEPYKLITMDVVLPGMNGQDTVQAIREIEAEHGICSIEDSVKILMISGMADGQNIISSFRKGCEAYLVKPFDEDQFLKALEHLSCYF